MGNNPSTQSTPKFSFPTVIHNTGPDDKRALFERTSDGTSGNTGIRFDIVWGIAVLLLVLIVLRQWYRARGTYKAKEQEYSSATEDLEGQKTTVNNMRG
ncbi:uncharacterized protein BT62DRAFT_652220 [Guyanagaster necrorhizus]|uniref:Uncharacterized protein n=1 Tax=Guyanagaster necrorhizus TaxID=856835 RepID=A0A9P8AL66_9AGAR|nr:uncharacterized protein BT62DRAFT_652220 [Guyanagaster necrorhizus MCA 3950]KAG7439908.1 hypothetical protein BT62DRAFT_652220 [Guyanagaster necrorhizus MCA 3950]